MMKGLEAEKESLQHIQGQGSGLHRRICLTICIQLYFWVRDSNLVREWMYTSNLNYDNLNYELIIQTII